MKFLVTILLFLPACWPLGSEEVLEISLRNAVRMAVHNSPELESAKEQLGLAGLEEPLVLANTDPVFSVSAGVLDDRSPRSSPAFMGPYTRAQTFETSVDQTWLMGTQAKLAFSAERVRNPAMFRVLDPTVDSRLSLEVRQPILKHFWGRPDRATRAQARAGVRIARARLYRLKETVAAGAVRAYLELLFALRALEVSKAAKEDARKLFDTYLEKKPYGLVEETDLLQAEASLKARIIETRRAASRRQLAGTTFRNALGIDDTTDFELRMPDMKELPRSTETVIGTAMSMRKDLEAAAAQVERSSWSLRIESLNILPDLSLFGSYSAGGLDTGVGNSFSDMGGFGHPVLSGGISLQIPFRSRREKLQIEGARRTLAADKAELRRLQRQVRFDVLSALERISEAEDRHEAALELLELERRKLAAGESDFRRGRVTTDLLIRLMSDVHRAEIELFRARTDKFLGLADLALARGAMIEWVEVP